MNYGFRRYSEQSGSRVDRFILATFVYMKWFFAIVFFSLVFAGITSCEEEKEVTETKITASNIDSLIAAHPDSVPLLIWRGEYRLKEYQHNLAMQDAAKAYRMDKSNLKAKVLFADVLINRAERSPQDVSNAQSIFMDVLKKDKKNLRALVGVAATYTFQQDFEKSFDYLNRALRIDRHYKYAYVLKGTNYMAMGRMDDAKSSYETAVQQDPNFYEGYFFLANIYEAEGNPQCVQYYQNALELRPHSQEIRYKLAYAQQMFDKIEDALSNYRVLAKDTMDFYSNRGYFHQGHIHQFVNADVDSAIHYYNKALQVEPRHVESWHNLGTCYDFIGNKTKALQSFAKAVKYNPEFTLSQEYADSIRLLPANDRRPKQTQE